MVLQKLNSNEPWIRVGPHIMHGRHERMLGSDLLFELPPGASRTRTANHRQEFH